MDKKDILVVRVPERYNLDLEEKEIVVQKYKNVLSIEFHVIILWDENNDYKTQFEIIKA
jgi:hypothetical protein